MLWLTGALSSPFFFVVCLSVVSAQFTTRIKCLEMYSVALRQTEGDRDQTVQY